MIDNQNGLRDAMVIFDGLGISHYRLLTAPETNRLPFMDVKLNLT